MRLRDLYADQLLARLAHDVHGSGDAGIEAVDGAQNLDRLLGIVQRVAFERRLVRAVLPLRVARSRVPGGRHHRLVIRDLAAADDDPVTERTARGLGVPGALRFGWP